MVDVGVGPTQVIIACVHESMNTKGSHMAAQASTGNSGRAHRSDLLRCLWKCSCAGNELMGSQELTCGSGPALEVGCRTDGCNMMQPFVLCLLCMCATQSILARGAPLANSWQRNEQISIERHWWLGFIAKIHVIRAYQGIDMGWPVLSCAKVIEAGAAHWHCPCCLTDMCDACTTQMTSI